MRNQFVFTALALLCIMSLAQTERLYSVNNDDGSISGFGIDKTSGALNQLAGSPFTPSPIGFDARYPRIDPLGRFMYVPYSIAVTAWSINPASGALAPVVGSPFSVGIDPRRVTFDPTGRFAFFTDINSSKVAAMAINPANGALSPIPGSPFEAGTTGFSGAVVEPKGHFVYFGSNGAVGLTYGNGPIAAFAINQSNGSLTPVPGSPFQAGVNLDEMAVDPSGRFLYATDAGDGGPGQVLGFNIQASGALVPIPGSPFGAGVPMGPLAVDPSGSFAYVVGGYGNSQLFAYAIDHTTGALTPLAGSPYLLGTFATDADIDPSGKFLYLLKVVIVQSRHYRSIRPAAHCHLWLVFLSLCHPHLTA